MTTKETPKIWNLIQRYKWYLIIGLLFALSSIGTSLYINYKLSLNQLSNLSWEKLADFLMTFGETILGAGLIGGGIGASINFILEELKKEEEAAEEKLKLAQEAKEKRKVFRKEMRKKLQHAHDEVELARILIKSHKSGKTYGEQIRNRIMPTLISLVEFKRSLMDVEDPQLSKNLVYLKVSLRYMIAYLSVLVEEFEANYIMISHLQNHQDDLTKKLSQLLLSEVENKSGNSASKKKKKQLLKNTEKMFKKNGPFPKIELVWDALQSLDFIWDFIGNLRNKNGERSIYNHYFLQHYFHCKKLLKAKDNGVNAKFLSKKFFLANIKELARIEEKEKNDRPLTKQDSLTRHIMEKGIRVDLSKANKKV